MAPPEFHSFDPDGDPPGGDDDRSAPGPTRRPRRLRADGVRGLVSETDLRARDLVAPVFVDATADRRRPIESMPGHDRVPVAAAVDRVNELLETGVEAVILFGVPESKDARGSRAYAEDGVVQRATRRVKRATDAYVIADLCLCEYTDHGHCGVLEEGAGGDDRGPESGDADDAGSHDGPGDGAHVGPGPGPGGGHGHDAHRGQSLTVDNDATLELYAETAVSQAAAGADMVAPSGMMDGQVGAIRRALDREGFESTPVMAYAAKYESAFYGPFRDAADGAPAFGDRRHYQMDPANRREARREVARDVEQGADVLMIKPALPYLDVVADVRAAVDHPVAAYNVSGEYAMLHAAADRGWLDLEATAVESLTAIRRAGADLILTYFAETVADRL